MVLAPKGNIFPLALNMFLDKYVCFGFVLYLSKYWI